MPGNRQLVTGNRQPLTAHALLSNNHVTRLLITCLAAVLLASCTGGRESKAAEEQLPKKNPIVTSTATPQPPPPVDVKQQLKTISPAIPLYAGAAYRDDLTRRDT